MAPQGEGALNGYGQIMKDEQFMTDEEGHDQHARFFSLLGEAVSTWAYIEGKLYEIVRGRLGAPDLQAAIVFGRTPQMSAHVALAEELLVATLPVRHPSLKEWDGLAKRLKKALPIRNMMVHQPVHFGGSATVSLRADEAGNQYFEVTDRSPEDYAFGLSEVTQRRQKPKLPETLTADDITNHLATVRQLNLDLSNFHKALPPL